MPENGIHASAAARQICPTMRPRGIASFDLDYTINYTHLLPLCRPTLLPPIPCNRRAAASKLPLPLCLAGSAAAAAAAAPALVPGPALPLGDAA